MDQCSMARHPISAEGTLTGRSGRDLALEVDDRFSCQRRSPTGGSVNSVSPTETYRAEARCSIPISWYKRPTDGSLGYTGWIVSPAT